MSRMYTVTPNQAAQEIVACISAGLTPLLSNDLLKVILNLPRKMNAHGPAEDCARTLGALL